MQNNPSSSPQRVNIMRWVSTWDVENDPYMDPDVSVEAPGVLYPVFATDWAWMCYFVEKNKALNACMKHFRRIHPQGWFLASEVFARLHDPNREPRTSPNPSTILSLAHVIHNALNETPSFKELQEATKSSPFLIQQILPSLLHELSKGIPSPPENQNENTSQDSSQNQNEPQDDSRQNENTSQDSSQNQNTSQDSSQNQNASNGSLPMDSESAKQESDLRTFLKTLKDGQGGRSSSGSRVALEETVKELSSEAGDMRECMDSAFGDQDHEMVMSRDPNASLDLMQMLSTSRAFQRLLQSLGSWKKRFQEERGKNLVRGEDTPQGIERSLDPSRWFPATLSHLFDEDLEYLNYLHLASGGLKGAGRISRGKSSMGGVVLYLDCSGSMQFIMPDALACACAMYITLQRRNRTLHLVPFNTKTFPMELPSSGMKELALCLKKISSIRADGGTKFDACVDHYETMPKKDKQKLDVVFISDGDGALNVQRANQVFAHARIVYISVGHGSSTSLDKISSQTFRHVDLSKPRKGLTQALTNLG